MSTKILSDGTDILSDGTDILAYTGDPTPLVPSTTALLKGNGSGDIVAATADTDYVTPSGMNTALGAYIPLTQKAANNGVATLDSTGKVPASQLRAAFIVSASAPSDTSVLWIDSNSIMRYYSNNAWVPIVPTWG